MIDYDKKETPSPGDRLNSLKAALDERPQLKRFLWQRKVTPAFWTTASVISLTINVILIVALILLGRELFGLKNLVTEQLLYGLYDNFVLMDDANIDSIINVDDSLPVIFDLPVIANTTVILTEDTTITGARVWINSAVLNINNASATIMLPAGTELPIALNIMVPVDTTVPVVLNIPISIPLNQTDLHTPFVGLQSVLAPYLIQLYQAPNSWNDVLCRVIGLFCR